FLAESQALTINSTADSTFTIIVKHFVQHINTAEGVEKNLLQYFYARFLLANQHRYLSASTDIFIAQNATGKQKMIDSLFNLSLARPDLLIREPIQKWTDTFEEQQNISLTPTLFHFLAHHYLLFLRSYESDKMPWTDKLIHLLSKLNEKHSFADASMILISYILQLDCLYSESMRPQIQTNIRLQKSDYYAFLYYKIVNVYTVANNP